MTISATEIEQYIMLFLSYTGASVTRCGFCLPQEHMFCLFT